MLSNLANELLAGVVVAAGSGVVGAAYQLHRRRSRPFVLVTEVRGDSFAEGEEVDVPEEVRRRLERSVLFRTLGPKEPLSRVHRVFQEEREFGRKAPAVSAPVAQAVKSLERASSDQDILEAIVPPLRKTLFDAVITSALMAGRIAISEPKSPVSPKVKVYYEESQREGCFYFDFPGGPIYFGSDLEKSTFRKDRLSHFVDAVRVLDQGCLRSMFSDLAQILDQEAAIADATKGQLERIIDERSGWETYLYVANYGETAMLILPEGFLEVRKRRFERTLKQKCDLAVFYEKDGEERKRVEKNGVLIPPGHEKRIVFVTVERQGSMSAGNELRGLFEDGVSRARIVFQCVSAGLRAKRAVKTPWLPFKGAA